MRSIRFAKPFIVCLAALIGLSACTNVFRARGLVLNPTYVYPAGSTEVPRFPRVLVIVRKETRLEKQNRIVGIYADVQALKPFQEFAAIPEQKTDGGALYVDTRIFSNYKDELSESGLEKYQFWLELPDGRKIKGKVHVQRGLKDYSSSLSGYHMQTHQIVRDANGVTAYRHVEEVQDDFNLYSRSGRILFVAPRLVDLQTPYVVFVIKGYEREWRYRFDFTDDPYKAAAWAAAHQED